MNDCSEQVHVRRTRRGSTIVIISQLSLMTRLRWAIIFHQRFVFSPLCAS